MIHALEDVQAGRSMHTPRFRLQMVKLKGSKETIDREIKVGPFSRCFLTMPAFFALTTTKNELLKMTASLNDVLGALVPSLVDNLEIDVDNTPITFYDK